MNALEILTARCFWGLGTAAQVRIRTSLWYRHHTLFYVKSWLLMHPGVFFLSFFHFCWSNDNAMMRTSCFLGLERNKLKPPLAFAPSVQVHFCFLLLSFFFSTQVSNRLSPSFDIKAAYMKGLIRMVLGALKMDMIKNTWRQLVSDLCGHIEQGFWRGAGTLNSDPFCAEKGGISWANNIWISFVCQTKQKLTTILSFYFDRYDPHSLVEFKLEADTSGEAHLSVCVRCTVLIASIGPLMTLAYLRAESLTNTATLRSQGSVHRTLLDESEWEIFQACKLIRLHVWF